ncbi:MAG TPA: DUF4148 domain-containing protein [Albitalea sp.]
MNRHILIAATTALSLLGAASAFAQEATQDAPPAMSSSTSRADVKAELDAARSEGEVGFREASPAPEEASTLPAAQVRAEAREAARLGLTRFTEAGQAIATPDQLEAIRLAGQRAVGTAMAQQAQ